MFNFDSIDKFPVWNKLRKFQSTDATLHAFTGNRNTWGAGDSRKPTKQGAELIALIYKTILLCTMLIKS